MEMQFERIGMGGYTGIRGSAKMSPQGRETIFAHYPAGTFHDVGGIDPMTVRFSPRNAPHIFAEVRVPTLDPSAIMRAEDTLAGIVRTAYDPSHFIIQDIVYGFAPTSKGSAPFHPSIWEATVHIIGRGRMETVVSTSFIDRFCQNPEILSDRDNSALLAIQGYFGDRFGVPLHPNAYVLQMEGAKNGGVVRASIRSLDGSFPSSTEVSAQERHASSKALVSVLGDYASRFKCL